MHRCIALSCLLVKALSVYLKVYFLSIVHILCKFNRFSRGGRIFSVFGCNYFFILGIGRPPPGLLVFFMSLFPLQTIYMPVNVNEYLSLHKSERQHHVHEVLATKPYSSTERGLFDTILVSPLRPTLLQPK